VLRGAFSHPGETFEEVEKTEGLQDGFLKKMKVPCNWNRRDNQNYGNHDEQLNKLEPSSFTRVHPELNPRESGPGWPPPAIRMGSALKRPG
jgi:hypothetical protein